MEEEVREYLDGPDQVLPATSFKCWLPSDAVSLQISPTGAASQAPVSVYSMLKEASQNHPNQVALAHKVDGIWKHWTYKEYLEDSCTVAKAFIKLGLDRFHTVCIMGFNCPQWLIGNFGAIFAGGLSAGVYTTNSPDACRHLAEDSKAQIILVENEACLKKFLEVKHKLPLIKKIVQWGGDITTEGVMSWAELMELGRQEGDAELQDRIKRQAVNQCCSLIYTSGTTGPPKGVMCSQDSLTWVGKQHCECIQLETCSEHVISFLPLSHLAAQMGDMYMLIQAAGTLHFAQPDALKGSLGTTMKEVQPTGFLAVPRLWEKIYERMQILGKEVGGVKKKVATWAKAQGLNYYTAMKEGRTLSVSEQFQFSLARYVILGKVKEALGLSRCHNLVSGTAPISKDILEYFMSLDLPINEGYGLTESLSVGSISSIGPKGFKQGSVGKVPEYTSLKLMESTMSNKPGEGEIAFRGRNVFMGYLNLPDKTNETIADDGWMVTGDLGWFDEDGFLYITGRVKELVITAGGENVPPVLIEDCIKKELPILSNALLIGDKQKYLSILLTIKSEVDEDARPLDTLDPQVVQWCKDRGCNATTVTQLREQLDSNRSCEMARDIQKAIEVYNTDHAISNAQRVQRWMVLPHDFSLPTGELNNTLKLKRSVTVEMYKDTIALMYSDDYPGLKSPAKL